MAQLPQQGGGLSDIQFLLDTFRGKNAVQTTSSSVNSSEQVSADKNNALIKSILEGTGGLASVSSGQKAAGLYGTSTNSMLSNDLVARAAGQVASLSANKNTTTNQSTGTVQKPQLDLGKSLFGLGASTLLAPTAKAASKKLGLDDIGNTLADSIFGAPAAATNTTGTTLASLSSQAGIDTSYYGTSAAASDSLLGTLGGEDAILSPILGSTAGASAGADVLGEDLSSSGAIDAAGTLAGVGESLGAAEGVGAAVEGATVAGEAGGIGDIIATAVAAWIICTELNKQGRLPTRYYRHGAKEFLKYDSRGKQGYYIWAIPSVIHLRKHPNSLYSKLMEIVFNARAEYLSAKAGCQGARKTLLGAITTHGLYAVCWILSRTIARTPVTLETILKA